MVPIGCQKTSARNYHSTRREIPQERRSQIRLNSPRRPNSLWGPQRLKSGRYWGSCPRSEKAGRESEHFPTSNTEANAKSYISRPDMALWPAEGHPYLYPITVS